MTNFNILKTSLIFFHFLVFSLSFPNTPELPQKEPEETSALSDYSGFSYQSYVYDDRVFVSEDFSPSLIHDNQNLIPADPEDNILLNSINTEDFRDSSELSDENSTLEFIKPVQSESNKPFGISLKFLISCPQLSAQEISALRSLESELKYKTESQIEKILSHIGINYSSFLNNEPSHNQKILLIIYPFLQL